MELSKLPDYKGKPVQSLIDDLGSDMESYRFVDEPPGRLLGCALTLEDGTRLLVKISSWRNLKKFDEKRSWTLEQLIDETIDTVFILDSTAHYLNWTGGPPFRWVSIEAASENDLELKP